MRQKGVFIFLQKLDENKTLHILEYYSSTTKNKKK